jgi:hypothetical protein
MSEKIYCGAKRRTVDAMLGPRKEISRVHNVRVPTQQHSIEKVGADLEQLVDAVYAIFVGGPGSGRRHDSVFVGQARGAL